MFKLVFLKKNNLFFTVFFNFVTYTAVYRKYSNRKKSRLRLIWKYLLCGLMNSKVYVMIWKEPSPDMLQNIKE